MITTKLSHIRSYHLAATLYIQSCCISVILLETLTPPQQYGGGGILTLIMKLSLYADVIYTMKNKQTSQIHYSDISLTKTRRKISLFLQFFLYTVSRAVSVSYLL